jgi:hypothetical protein
VDILRSKGVAHFQTGDLIISLGPQPMPDAPPGTLHDEIRANVNPLLYHPSLGLAE